LWASQAVNSERRLSASDAEVVVAQVAGLSSAGAPLVEGLRAAAEESSSARVAWALRNIADRLEQGISLETILEDQSQLLPGHVRGLVAAATRTGRLGLALEGLIEHQRQARAVWWGVAASIAYPLLVFGLTLALLALFPLFIVPPFKVMFDEFQLALPIVTEMMIRTSDIFLWIAESAGWVLLVAFGLMFVGMFLLATGWGGGPLQRFLATVPFAGPLWHWSGTAAGARLLAILLDHEVPLPEALRLTGYSALRLGSGTLRRSRRVAPRRYGTARSWAPCPLGLGVRP